MSLMPRDFPDLVQDNIVQALRDFADEQSSIDDAVGFHVERGMLRPYESTDMPLVNVFQNAITPEQERSAARKVAHERTELFIDCYAIGVEGDIAADQNAMLRLEYLRAQVRHALYRLSQVDFGFSVGTIAAKPFPRWTGFIPELREVEAQIIAGRWTIEIDYEWSVEDDVETTPLDKILVSESTKGAYAALYDF